MYKIVIGIDDLATNALIPLREKLDLEARKRNLKIPPNLDLTVDCVLVAHFLTWAHNLVEDKNYYNDKLESSIVNHIYNKNISKILSRNISDSDYSFQIEKNIPDFKTTFLKMDVNKSFALEVILNTIKTSQKEIVNVLKSYQSGDPFNPVTYFFNCFIHPSVVIDFQKIFPLYENTIKNNAAQICDFLIVETRLYMQEISNNLRKEQNDLNEKAD